MNLPTSSWTYTSKFASSDTWMNTALSKALYSRFFTFLREKLAFFRHAPDDLGDASAFFEISRNVYAIVVGWRSTTGFAILKRNNHRRQTRKIVDGCFLRVADTFAVAPREKSSPDNGCETHNGNWQLPIGLSSSISSRSHHQPLQPPRTSPGDLRCESSSSTNTMRNYLAITLSRLVLLARRNRFYFIRFYCRETDVAWPFATAFSNTHYKMR